VTLRGNGQGVDKCNLYCTNHFNTESKSGRSRFDWVEIVQGRSKAFVQLSALVQLLDERPGEEFGCRSELMYFGSSVVTSPKEFEPSGARYHLAPVFPRLKYEVTYDNRLFTVFDSVDSIILPACVLPVTMNRDDYLLTNKLSRAAIRFMYIPFHFWFRDDWGKADANVFDEIFRNVHNSISVRQYLTANRENRARKYAQLKQTLQENTLETQELDDIEIVQRHLEFR